ncbi:MAG: HDIG domain-containing metalloprotein [Cyanobacteria bacterium P01_D01_bin.105]
MGVFRRISSRAIHLWSQAFLWLKQAGDRLLGALGWRINQRCSPLLIRARRFFVLDGIFQAVSQKRGVSVSNAQSRVSKTKRSIGQTLISQWRLRQSFKRLWICVLVAILLLGACFGQRFYSQPGLDIKATAPQAFYAPETATFENKIETERRRSDVREGAVPLLKVDNELTASAFRSLETLLSQGRELRERAGSPPFLNPKVLSKPTQDFLFQASDAQWKTIWRLAAMPSLSSAQLEQFAFGHISPAPDPKIPGSNGTEKPVPDVSPAAPQPAEGRVQQLPTQQQKPIQQKPTPSLAQDISQIKAFDPDQMATLRELVAYRELANSDGLAKLKIRLGVPRAQYRKAASDLARAASTEGQPLYNYRLFELTDTQWTQLEENAQQLFSEMMLQGIPQGLPTAQLRRAIEERVDNRVDNRSDPSLRQLIVDVLLFAASPNLVVDEEGTKQLAEQAMKQIAPVMVSIQKGELIVPAGETIDADDFALLDYFGLTSRYFNWLGLSGFSLLAAGMVAVYLWVDHVQDNHLSLGDHGLVLLLCLVVALLARLGVPAAGLPLVGLLVGSFYGAILGLTVVLLLSLLLLFGPLTSPVPLMAGAAAAFVGAWIAPQLRAREEFALLGGFVGLTQGSVHLVLTLMRSTVAAPLWKVVFLESALHGLYGIAWSIVAMGLSPYLEHFFDVVTPIRLAELANPNRPLLKRLSAEAPGTFQHTMFVANLAEAAARALGRNVELVRAGTLYHDIGKMHDPQSFIENQMGAPNKHDELNDPWLSASIIKKHVTQGIVMARKYRLPKAVQAFIPEHQGDMKISYFYHQAKERQRKEPSLVVNESDFTYDGPIPQSPETGITMLADSCEAALRSLTSEASMDDAYRMVDGILRARWRNRQLVDSGLSRDDMDLIASVFIQVWQQHNHKRIAYPKQR